MPRKPPSQAVGGPRTAIFVVDAVPLMRDYSKWIVDYDIRCDAKNALAKARKKEADG